MHPCRLSDGEIYRRGSSQVIRLEANRVSVKRRAYTDYGHRAYLSKEMLSGELVGLQLDSECLKLRCNTCRVGELLRSDREALVALKSDLEWVACWGVLTA
eukprot:scaffold151508_cov29-Tisochrysis_lutea.AAC.5